jgi:hypothetical protein
VIVGRGRINIVVEGTETVNAASGTILRSRSKSDREMAAGECARRTVGALGTQ